MPTDDGRIITLTADHAAGGLALSVAAGWNQTEADWKFLLDVGQPVGIEDGAGRLIATAMTLPQGADFGWISMVLVDEAHRGQGLATGLLNSCLRTLKEAGLVAVLDATEFGEPVYRPLGFEAQSTYQRWAIHDTLRAEELSQLKRVSQSVSLEPADEACILQVDEIVFGGKRPLVLQNLLERSSEFSAMTQAGDGFVLGREGTRAWQIGPLSAATPEDGLALLAHAIEHIGMPVFIDVCDTATQFISALKSVGFRPQRQFIRMAKMAKTIFGIPRNSYALAGPELG